MKNTAFWGNGKKQILALLPEIHRKKRSGNTLREIYTDLSQQGRVTASQATFYRYAKQKFGS